MDEQPIIKRDHPEALSTVALTITRNAERESQHTIG